MRATQAPRERLERRRPTDEASQRLGLYLTADTAHTHHAHQKLAEAVIELPDVSEHPHACIVQGASWARPFSAIRRTALYA